MAMTHVGNTQTVLLRPLGATGSASEPRYHITGGPGWYNVRRSPTNIKTNPNFSGFQRTSPSGPKTSGKRDEDSGNKQRPRSMVILGTSRTNDKNNHKKSLEPAQIAEDKDRPKVAASNPDVRQTRTRSSNPDIGKQQPNRELSNGNVGEGRRPRGGSESNILDEDDLDRPEYERGLSSPYVGQGQGRNLTQARNRSVSLGVLQRSHDCLRTGINGTCQCTVKLYRPPGPDKKIDRKAASGSIPSMVGQPNQGSCEDPRGQPKSKTISDSDVSSFFRPSATVWDPYRRSEGPQRGKLNRPHSVHATGNTGRGTSRDDDPDSPRTSFLRPKSDDELPKPWALRLKNSQSRDTKPRLDDNGEMTHKEGKPNPDTPAENGYGGANIAPKPTSIKRSTSLPEPRSWKKYSPPETTYMGNGLSGSEQETAPPKPPRSMIDNIKPLSSDMNVTEAATGYIETLTEEPHETAISTPSTSEAAIVHVKELFNPAVCVEKKPSADPIQNDIALTTSTPEIHSLGESYIPPGKDTDPSKSSEPVSDQPKAPGNSPVNYNYKPLYSEMMGPSNRWFTPYDNTTPTTYFTPHKSILPRGRDPNSYGYNSQEDKAKVMALLDRYSASGRSNLGLSREEMTNYLNSTKRKLGLDKTGINKDVENVKEDTKGNKSEDVFEKPCNGQDILGGQPPAGQEVQPDEDKENIKPNEPFGYVIRPKYTTIPPGTSPPKIADTTNRVPSMVNSAGGINTEGSDKSTSALEPSPVVAKPNNIEREIMYKKPTSIEKRPVFEQDSTTPEMVLMTQTTFHVDGAITESPAIRRRTSTSSLRRSSDDRFPADDVNNNQGKISTTFGAASTPNDREVSTNDNGAILHSIRIPCYQMWKIDGALDLEADTPEELEHTGLTSGDYDAVCPYLNDAIRQKQLLSTLDTWQHGSYLALIFMVVWLCGFVVCYCLGVVSHWSPGLLFILAILLISGAAVLIRSSKPKIRNNIQRSMTQANTMLARDNLLAVIDGDRSGILGATLHFVYFDVSQCKKTLTDSISDKMSEDLLLTEVSRDFPCLMDILSDSLQDICSEPEELGRKVIARDILMYFAASYLEVFLFEDKKNPRNGKQIGETPGGGHGKDCLCDHVKKHAFPRVEYHSLVNPNPGTEKLRACKPTFL